MGRWIVILSLAMAPCPDVAGAAQSNIPLPKPRPTRSDPPAQAAVAAPHAVNAIAESAATEPVAEESPVQDSPVQTYPAQPYPDQVADVGASRRLMHVEAPAPTKSGKASGRGCTGGRRIISAFYWEGQRTASGQRFNPRGMTAAHRSLPFGTRLTVSNPRTGKSVTVVVNDRGPYVSGVSLDLSLGAAQTIGMHGTGAVCMW
jgi:rare lipoprotein A